MSPSSLSCGALILLSSCACCAIADPTSYFPGVAADERSAYADWVISSSSAYPRHAYMSHDDDDDDGAAVFWNVVDGDMIHLAIVVRAMGWVGIGFSEAGGMIGSDVVLYRASDPSVVVDAHIVGDRSTPITDDCQDWTLDAVVATGEEDARRRPLARAYPNDRGVGRRRRRGAT